MPFDLVESGTNVHNLLAVEDEQFPAYTDISALSLITGIKALVAEIGSVGVMVEVARSEAVRVDEMLRLSSSKSDDPSDGWRIYATSLSSDDSSIRAGLYGKLCAHPYDNRAARYITDILDGIDDVIA